MSCLRWKQQEQQFCRTHRVTDRTAAFPASLPPICCRETRGTQSGWQSLRNVSGVSSIETAFLPTAFLPPSPYSPSGRALLHEEGTAASEHALRVSAAPRAPGRHLPVHAALQVGHGALPARAALEAAVAEALHEALLEGAALSCNTRRGSRYRRARAGARAAPRGSGARRRAALPHRSDPAGRRPCPAAAV